MEKRSKILENSKQTIKNRMCTIKGHFSKRIDFDIKILFQFIFLSLFKKT
jgi:hypothetical protein